MEENMVWDLFAEILGDRPLSLQRMTLTHSGNVVYGVQMRDQELIVRTATRRGVFDRTAQNIQALRRLDLPVPRIVALDLSRDRYPAAWMILEKLPGRDLYFELPTMIPRQMSHLAEQIVEFEQRVIGLPEGKGYGWGHIGEGGQDRAWFYVFQSEEQSDGPRPDGSRLGDLRVRIHRQLTRFQPYFRDVRPTCFLDDLTIKNILIQEGELTGLIDFDCVCFGDPLWMIGLAAGCVANDLGTRELFYVEELCRCWGLDQGQREVVALYAAIRAMEFATGASAEPGRDERLCYVMDRWLQRAEGRSHGRILAVEPAPG